MVYTFTDLRALYRYLQESSEALYLFTSNPVYLTFQASDLIDRKKTTFQKLSASDINEAVIVDDDEQIKKITISKEAQHDI